MDASQEQALPGGQEREGTFTPAELDRARAFVAHHRAVLRSASPTSPASRQALERLLEWVWRRPFASAMEPRFASPWGRLLVESIEGADYSLPRLFASRERQIPSTLLLRVPPSGSEAALELTVKEMAERGRALARALLALLGDEPRAPIALLSENRFDGALLDLGCLANGLFVVPLPANAAPSQLLYMLGHCRARLLAVDEGRLLDSITPHLGALPHLKALILIPSHPGQEATPVRGHLTFAELLAQGERLPDSARADRANAVQLGELATLLYTSGTTGEPKAIPFTQRNLIAKRLCRALALPDLGEGDRFLSILPFFHTFGRWFELLGSLYWGATCVLARSPALPNLLHDFERERPTLFIGVPKKWVELHRRAQRDAAGSSDLGGSLRALTGGALRFGLSAAGYLEPALFTEIQGAGIALSSGYGLTEATGGVTMTPPGDYREGSIGVALPGIELTISDENELLLKGPYVMPGYHAPPDGVSGLDGEGRFATGDLVEELGGGHLRLIGRKKEIYKSRRGQTIAPHRVEALIRATGLFAQAFLAGDGREENVLLVWPDLEHHPELRTLDGAALAERTREAIAEANRALAPYERIAAFALLTRPLDEAHGELTAKGSLRREAIEANWREVLERATRDSRV